MGGGILRQFERPAGPGDLRRSPTQIGGFPTASAWIGVPTAIPTSCFCVDRALWHPGYARQGVQAGSHEDGRRAQSREARRGATPGRANVRTAWWMIAASMAVGAVLGLWSPGGPVAPPP